MAYTYSKISSVTVGSGGVSSIDFIAIPQNYDDLILNWSTRVNSVSVATRFTLNGDGSAIYFQSRTYGGNGGVFADATVDASWWDFKGNVSSNNLANIFSNSQLYIPNYSNKDTFKIGTVDFAGEDTGTNWEIGFSTGVYKSTNSIHSIRLWRATDIIQQYSTATLYGIKAEV